MAELKLKIIFIPAEDLANLSKCQCILKKKKKKCGEECVSSVLRKKYLIKANSEFTFRLTIAFGIYSLQNHVGTIGFICFSI